MWGGCDNFSWWLVVGGISVATVSRCSAGANRLSRYGNRYPNPARHFIVRHLDLRSVSSFFQCLLTLHGLAGSGQSGQQVLQGRKYLGNCPQLGNKSNVKQLSAFMSCSTILLTATWNLSWQLSILSGATNMWGIWNLSCNLSTISGATNIRATEVSQPTQHYIAWHPRLE